MFKLCILLVHRANKKGILSTLSQNNNQIQQDSTSLTVYIYSNIFVVPANTSPFFLGS